jgi:hypothetical protein
MIFLMRNHETGEYYLLECETIVWYKFTNGSEECIASETLVNFHQTIWPHIPEDSIHQCENLKIHINKIGLKILQTVLPHRNIKPEQVKYKAIFYPFLY